MNWLFRAFTLLSTARQSRTMLYNAKAALTGAKRTLNNIQTLVFQEALRKAQEGNGEAQYDCGERYFYGDGVPRDDGEAFQWFLKAAHQGHAKAQANAGLLYALGRGVPADLVEAAVWLSLAARQGDEKAKRTLEKLRRKLSPEQQRSAQARLAEISVNAAS